MPSPVKLNELIRGVPRGFWVVPPAAPDASVRALCHDSRRTQPGDLFFALPGEHADGVRFVPDALSRGAVAVVVEGSREVDAPPEVVLRARCARRTLGVMAALFHGEPSRAMRVVGLTGTDGKTSTSWLTRHILACAGRRAVAAGTLGLKGDGEQPEPWEGRVEGNHPDGEAPHRSWRPTTPEAPDFQQTLARLVARGIDDVITEVSSHALAQDRVYGTQFHTVVLLGVSTDHLDFHGSEEEYLAAKARLFRPADRGGPLERRPVRAVIHIDHPLGRRLARAWGDTCLTFGRSPEAQVRLLSAENEVDGQRLEIAFGDQIERPRVGLRGHFHAENLLAAVAIGQEMGVDRHTLLRALESAPTIPGRFEAIHLGQPYTVLVDYAHTADALARVLEAARGIAPGRLILVFGCGGDRDASKRVPMGRVAARLADRVILTDDNPRSEDPEAIAREVAEGLSAQPVPWERVADRRRALAQALEEARAGDVVVAAGKGAEVVQVFADRVESFDDRQVLRDLMLERIQKGAAS